VCPRCEVVSFSRLYEILLGSISKSVSASTFKGWSIVILTLEGKDEFMLHACENIAASSIRKTVYICHNMCFANSTSIYCKHEIMVYESNRAFWNGKWRKENHQRDQHFSISPRIRSLRIIEIIIVTIN
jgi:hypothetical protein